MPSCYLLDLGYLLVWMPRGALWKTKCPPHSLMKKLCFIRLPPNTLQNFWQVITICFILIKVSNIQIGIDSFFNNNQSFWQELAILELAWLFMVTNYLLFLTDYLVRTCHWCLITNSQKGELINMFKFEIPNLAMTWLGLST